MNKQALISSYFRDLAITPLNLRDQQGQPYAAFLEQAFPNQLKTVVLLQELTNGIGIEIVLPYYVSMTDNVNFPVISEHLNDWNLQEELLCGTLNFTELPTIGKCGFLSLSYLLVLNQEVPDNFFIDLMMNLMDVPVRYQQWWADFPGIGTQTDFQLADYQPHFNQSPIPLSLPPVTGVFQPLTLVAIATELKQRGLAVEESLDAEGGTYLTTTNQGGYRHHLHLRRSPNNEQEEVVISSFFYREEQFKLLHQGADLQAQTDAQLALCVSWNSTALSPLKLALTYDDGEVILNALSVVAATKNKLSKQLFWNTYSAHLQSLPYLRKILNHGL